MNNLHVAIIGAGATGVAAFIALVRQGACKCITLLDASGPAIGQVYASQHPELLCNTSVELMSLLPPHYHDLLHYLHEHTNNEITLADFVSRKIIGDYIQDRYTRYLSGLSAGHKRLLYQGCGETDYASAGRRLSD
ncbi:hypothetical protein CKF42_17370 [Pantoea sp. ARC270]|uniref:FAD/NAD(P)-binding protein n=1 Tax=Pantoea sp. ARC270 TaxID=2027923 RepID=UPI000DA72FFC|nr:FAD/NAD(P)-binding protein [Pantoea sp. ARC270]PZL85374.1 hypothetical protein CKF42_17370 [Pantoea sp. ARC270]